MAVRESVKRTDEEVFFADFSRPLHGLEVLSLLFPTDESVGYFHAVRFADSSRFIDR